jgi:hypothetical protein
MEGAWQSQKTLPTVVHGQAFRFITGQPPSPLAIESAPLSSSVVLSPGNLPQYPGLGCTKLN